MARKYITVVKDGVVVKVFIKLIQDGDTVDLVAVDEAGQIIHDGYIASISDNGLQRYAYIGKSIGLPITKTLNKIKQNDFI